VRRAIPGDRRANDTGRDGQRAFARLRARAAVAHVRQRVLLETDSEPGDDREPAHHVAGCERRSCAELDAEQLHGDADVCYGSVGDELHLVGQPRGVRLVDGGHVRRRGLGDERDGEHDGGDDELGDILAAGQLARAAARRDVCYGSAAVHLGARPGNELHGDRTDGAVGRAVLDVSHLELK